MVQDEKKKRRGRVGAGYGSECHLLRYLGRHRTRLDEGVLKLCGSDKIAWLDFPFDRQREWHDGEWEGLKFLAETHEVQQVWREHWPHWGPPNWDAIARLNRNGASEWLLVEAKANLEELKSSCAAKEHGGLPQIRRTLDATKGQLGAAIECNWLEGYYQYCNRTAVLNLLNKNGVPARLLFIYFIGDRSGPGRTCPTDLDGWSAAISDMKAHVGLPADHPLSSRVHELFLEVCPA